MRKEWKRRKAEGSLRAFRNRMVECFCPIGDTLQNGEGIQYLRWTVLLLTMMVIIEHSVGMIM